MKFMLDAATADIFAPVAEDDLAVQHGLLKKQVSARMPRGVRCGMDLPCAFGTSAA